MTYGRDWLKVYIYLDESLPCTEMSSPLPQSWRVEQKSLPATRARGKIIVLRSTLTSVSLIVIFVIKTHSQLCSLVIFWKIYWFYLYFNGILMEELHLFWQWLKCNRAQTFGGKHFSSDRTLFFNFHQSLKMSEFESILGKLQTLQLPIGKFSLDGCY